MAATQVLIVAAAGAVGAVARWGTSVLAQNWLGKSWPVGTLIVNVLGCLIFGLAFELTRHSHELQPNARLLWLTGFCGAFTTFSTFAFDLYELHTTRGLALAAANAALHLVLGLAAIILGLAVGRILS